MKKNFLVLLIGFLVLIPGVKAEEYDTCFDDYLIGQVTLSYSSAYWQSIEPKIPVKESSTYYIRFFLSEDFTTTNGTRFSSSPVGYDSSGNSLSYVYIQDYSWDSEYHIFTFTTPSKEGLDSLRLSAYTWNTNYTILNNVYFAISENKDDLISCSSEVIDPEPVPVVPDSTLDNFYSIYLDKLGMLSNYAFENKFLFSSICIILLFIILEIILYLFKRGGFK